MESCKLILNKTIDLRPVWLLVHMLYVDFFNIGMTYG